MKKKTRKQDSNYHILAAVLIFAGVFLIPRMDEIIPAREISFGAEGGIENGVFLPLEIYPYVHCNREGSPVKTNTYFIPTTGNRIFIDNPEMLCMELCNDATTTPIVVQPPHQNEIRLDTQVCYKAMFGFGSPYQGFLDVIPEQDQDGIMTIFMSNHPELTP